MSKKKIELPTALTVGVIDDGYPQHVVIAQMGYLFLSEAALTVLRDIQKQGWEAFPMKAKAQEKRLNSKLAGETYYLLNVFLHRDIVDIEKSNLPPYVWSKGTKYEKTTRELTRDCRLIAINAELIGDTALWMGGIGVCTSVIFVADRLKQAWCDIGMNPAVFEPCIDI
jgi:hypothetical protein